jgi:hypothetical protein
MGGTFSIVDAPSFNAASVVRLTNGNVQFGCTAPGAAQMTVYSSTNLVNWQPLQVVPVTGGTAVFIDNTVTNGPARFYRLSIP